MMLAIVLSCTNTTTTTTVLRHY